MPSVTQRTTPDGQSITQIIAPGVVVSLWYLLPQHEIHGGISVNRQFTWLGKLYPTPGASEPLQPPPPYEE